MNGKELDLKQLDKLIGLLRKRGVSSYADGTLSLTLTPAASLSFSKRPYKRKKQHLGVQAEDVPSDGPTDEQLLYWSTASGEGFNPEQDN